MERANIFVAAETGNVNEVRRLVRAAGVDPHAPDGYGRTPLHYAAEEGRLAVVQYLLEEVHANVERKDDDECTALLLACDWNRFEVVRYLAEIGGANIETRDDRDDTPLHVTSFLGYGRIVRYLVERRQANVDVKNIDGNTPLDVAFARKKEDIIRYLLPRTSSVAEKTLVNVWEQENLVDIRRVVLEKYAWGQGLANSFHRNPIHPLLSQFPLSSAKAFQDSIKLFPSSALSLLNMERRLSIHVALTSQNNVVRSPSVIGVLFEREPRSALARDPSTGLYPHEAAAGLVNDDDGECWLSVAYRMFRTNPQRLLQSRVVDDGRSSTKNNENDECVMGRQQVSKRQRK